ncbi:uncharacterized protein IL334_006996 [Kwoniella shivajii]|uniref:Uncharacterized protein n=1 Tax=Kwoniella shivajii TaxID=564305 RepID=A0ABZ1D891_9TREE|nr:hypothetical protein IL334_006996 [Kwoniella shivajii]
MLISPGVIHSVLTSLLSSEPSSGPHTALLIYPTGQLVSSAYIPLDESSDSQDGDDAQKSDCQDVNVNGNDNDNDNEEEHDDDNDNDDDDDDEPYLEYQERKRLLLGLASQWNENESGKMECELGKLHFTYISLPPTPQPPSNSKDTLPPVKPYPVDGFILVLNGTKAVDWKILVEKAEEFKSKWRS